MRELLPELLDLLLPLFYGALVTALTVLGLGAELVGLSGAAAGLDTVSLWYVYLGTLGLVAAGVVAKRRLWPLLARPA